jgi:DNA-binding XRE family transcriptional regulator
MGVITIHTEARMRLIDTTHDIDIIITRGKDKVLSLLREAFPDIEIIDDLYSEVADIVGESACYSARSYDASSRLLMYRKQKGMTQGGLAERAGIKREALSMLENGKRNLGVNLAKKLAPALGVDYKDLLSDM